MRILILLAGILISAPAFSKHNYFNETCTVRTDKGFISLHKDPYFDGFHFFMNSDVPGLEYNQEVYLPGEEASKDELNRNEAIIFNATEDKNLRMERFDDGCWQGNLFYFTRTSTIEKIQPKVAEVLGWTTGDKITFECHYEELMIRGDSCNEE